MTLEFSRDFDPAYGRLVEIAPGIRRMTVANPSAFTFAGTNTYVVGEGRVAVIDPGPADPGHLHALRAALSGETITRILVTHTHRDHSPNAAALAAETGAASYGAGPHRPAPGAHPVGGSGRLDAAGDTAFVPTRPVGDGEIIEGEGFRLQAVATPGHADNHLAFALLGTDILFSGDHVMGWATTVVAPPDGSMRDYMASLDVLLARPESRYLPGHGGAVGNAHSHLRGLKAHRRMRERAILDRLAKGDETVPEIVAAIYRDVDPRLHGAAGLSTLAHLQDLVARGLVACGAAPDLAARYALAPG
ncbi:MBL fold metallo-hydrolase [Propylenella binzhouense]|uniref:MBL fold metallo-hydrolase n=1 Tax=Propylenella binzhouense TaxID=2555902 RepID=A0A964T3W1_9HYPH|nr:MBL fold metallo-hydrolase [Propylenella binzhouense]MYZ47910.1 MBL fold metallo-hydrolase [Propylenella binzhouense]